MLPCMKLFVYIACHKFSISCQEIATIFFEIAMICLGSPIQSCHDSIYITFVSCLYQTCYNFSLLHCCYTITVTDLFNAIPSLHSCYSMTVSDLLQTKPSYIFLHYNCIRHATILPCYILVISWLCQTSYNNLVTHLIILSSLLQIFKSLFWNYFNELGWDSSEDSLRTLVDRFLTDLWRHVRRSQLIIAPINVCQFRSFVHKLLTSSVHTACSDPRCWNLFGTSCLLLITSLMELSDLLQGCSNKTGTVVM